MNYEFLASFSPKIIDVVEREKQFWETFQYVLERDHTRLHVLAYVHSGQGMLELGGQRTPLAAGCSFQIPPGQSMRITTTQQNTLCFYSIHFRYGMIRWEGTELLLESDVGMLPLPPTQIWPENHEISEKFRTAFTIWTEKSGGYEWHVKQLLINLIQSFLQQQTSNQEPNSAHVVQTAIEWMKTSYNEELTREYMAERLAVSPGYFSVIFKKHTGLSPIQYLNKIRMDHAKHLLKNTKLPVKWIAEQVGFEDSFYFARIFSKETGMAPRDYRNS